MLKLVSIIGIFEKKDTDAMSLRWTTPFSWGIHPLHPPRKLGRISFWKAPGFDLKKGGDLRAETRGGEERSKWAVKTPSYFRDLRGWTTTQLYVDYYKLHGMAKSPKEPKMTRKVSFCFGSLFGLPQQKSSWYGFWGSCPKQFMKKSPKFMLHRWLGTNKIKTDDCRHVYVSKTCAVQLMCRCTRCLSNNEGYPSHNHYDVYNWWPLQSLS